MSFESDNLSGGLLYAFPTVIWCGGLKDDLADVKEKCLSISKSVPGRKISNEGGYQSPNIDLHEHNLSEVLEIFKDAFIKASSELYENCNIEIGNCWINVNWKGSFNTRHFHNDSTLSAVLYVNVPENSGDIIFHRGDNKELFPTPSTPKPIMFDWIKIQPKLGTVLVFPGWVNHEVGENNSDEPRISIAVNAVLKDAF